MDIIIKSKHKAFREYIATLLFAEKVKVHLVSITDDCINKAIQFPDAVIILDAHSEKPYHECESMVLLNKLKDKKEPVNNPVITLGWFECIKRSIPTQKKRKMQF